MACAAATTGRVSNLIGSSPFVHGALSLYDLCFQIDEAPADLALMSQVSVVLTLLADLDPLGGELFGAEGHDAIDDLEGDLSKLAHVYAR